MFVSIEKGQKNLRGNGTFILSLLLSFIIWLVKFAVQNLDFILYVKIVINLKILEKSPNVKNVEFGRKAINLCVTNVG